MTSSHRTSHNKQLQLTCQPVTRLAREEQGERQLATQLSLGR
jgi:hypothetical protein